MKIYSQHNFRQTREKDYTGVFVVVFFLSALLSLFAFLFAILALLK